MRGRDVDANKAANAGGPDVATIEVAGAVAMGKGSIKAIAGAEFDHLSRRSGRGGIDD